MSHKKSASKSHRIKAYKLLVINTIVWGAALVVTKPAFSFTTPYRFLFYRYLIATVFFSLFYLWKKRKVIKFKQLTTIAFLESLGTVLNLAILYIGLANTSAIEASLIGTTGPIFITLAGILLLKEKQEQHEWLGLSLAFVGMLFIVFTKSESAHQISIFGNFLVISYNLLNALYLVLAKKQYRNIDKKLVGAISFILGLIAFAGLAWFEASNQNLNLLQVLILDWQQPAVIIPAIYMAIFGSVIGLITYIEGQNLIETSEASLFTYLQPLIYLPLGLGLLQEKIYFQQMIGLAIILVGVLIAERRTHHYG